MQSAKFAQLSTRPMLELGIIVIVRHYDNATFVMTIMTMDVFFCLQEFNLSFLSLLSLSLLQPNKGATILCLGNVYLIHVY